MSLIEHRNTRRCLLQITATLENQGSCEGSQGSIFNGSMAAVETESQMKTWFTKHSALCVSADQVYGDQDMHEVVRKHCMDYLVRHFPPTHHTAAQTGTEAAATHQPGLFLQMKNADYFSNYVTEDFTTYINRKRKNNCHGNHIEMQAMAEMYNRPVEVYQYGTGESLSSKGWICPLSCLTPRLSSLRANQHVPWDPPKQR